MNESLKLCKFASSGMFHIITLCNLAGSDSADVQVLLQVVRLFPEQLLVVPPGFDPLLPGEKITYFKS